MSIHFISQPNKIYKPRLISTLFSILLMSFCCMFSNISEGLMNIVVDGGQIDGIPIAVVPFSVDAGGKGGDKGSFGRSDRNDKGNKSDFEDIARIIANDLNSSGQFKSISNSNIKQFPKHKGEVQYPYWQSMGIEDLIVGRIRKTSSSKYTVNFELIDVVRQNSGENQPPLYAMQFDNIHPTQFRALAHHISDLIFQKLIGVRGIFSTRIAYVSVKENGRGKGRHYTLEVADSDGHNPRVLYHSNFILMSPAWSPDGKKIAFVSYEKERSSVNVVDVASSRAERITQFPGMNNAPAWSPDGRTLAVVLSKDGSPKIYTVELGSKRITRLTEGGGADTEPCFSPDGRSIVFTSDRGGKPQIYRVTLASGQVDRLTFKGSYNAKPSLSPDGKNLITLHRDEGGLFNIAVHNLGSGTLKVLTHSSLNDSPTLAPNGMMVMFGSNEGGRGVLGAVTLDGRLKMRLPAQEGSVQEPAWSPFPPT